jgi:hypothetical protein
VASVVASLSVLEGASGRDAVASSPVLGASAKAEPLDGDRPASIAAPEESPPDEPVEALDTCVPLFEPLVAVIPEELSAGV